MANGGGWWIPNSPHHDVAAWTDALSKLPLCATVDTEHGPVGLVHACPVWPSWEELEEKVVGDGDENHFTRERALRGRAPPGPRPPLRRRGRRGALGARRGRAVRRHRTHARARAEVAPQRTRDRDQRARGGFRIPPTHDRADRLQAGQDQELQPLIAGHPSVQRALVACGAGATLAGAATWVGGYGDPWSLLGTGWGALVVAGALRLLGRAGSMRARIKEEWELRRLVLGFGALAGSSGAVVLLLAIARWQLETVTTHMLWITGAWAGATLAITWRAVRRLANYLEPREDEDRRRHERRRLSPNAASAENGLQRDRRTCHANPSAYRRGSQARPTAARRDRRPTQSTRKSYSTNGATGAGSAPHARAKARSEWRRAGPRHAAAGRAQRRSRPAPSVT